MISIDHVVIAGSDLAKLCATFESIGLMPVQGGIHADGQTHNALIPFADGSYLELIAPTPGNTAPDHPWGEFMRTDAGVCAWAIRSDDIQADVALYRSRDITVGDPTPGGRTRPDGVRLEWITAKLGDEPLGSLLPFLIQDITPRNLRVPTPTSGDKLITGVGDVLLMGERQLGGLLERAFEQPGIFKKRRRSIIYNGHKVGVDGVVLLVSDLYEARIQFHADKNLGRWFGQRGIWPSQEPMGIWPDLDHILLGFIGPTSQPLFDVNQFKLQIAETIAYCADVSHPGYLNKLRSLPFPKRPYWGFYDALFEVRRQRLMAENISIAPFKRSLAGGRLLVYDINRNLDEREMKKASDGYFDEMDETPRDTWVYYDPIDQLFVSWVPSEMIQFAQKGMDIMTDEWYWWLTGDNNQLGFEFIRILKREGFFDT